VAESHLAETLTLFSAPCHQTRRSTDFLHQPHSRLSPQNSRQSFVEPQRRLSGKNATCGTRAQSLTQGCHDSSRVHDCGSTSQHAVLTSLVTKSKLRSNTLSGTPYTTTPGTIFRTLDRSKVAPAAFELVLHAILSVSQSFTQCAQVQATRLVRNILAHLL
jgi:hypothetical protein